MIFHSFWLKMQGKAEKSQLAQKYQHDALDISESAKLPFGASGNWFVENRIIFVNIDSLRFDIMRERN